jgi:tryptophan synthase alpha chain
MAATATTPIMAHMVIGYPSFEESRAIAEQYIASGMQILELQIPFSHPTADGTVLTEANRKAVRAGTTLEMSFDFLKDLRAKHPEQRMMAMTYLNKLFSYGIGPCCDRLQEAGVPYLIVPDLPADSPLAQAIHDHPYVQLVPVVSANTSEDRLRRLLERQPDYVYLMADYKITGSGFSINPKIAAVVGMIRRHSQAKVGLGFGISERAQVEAVLQIADFAIVGSAFTQAIDAGTLGQKLAELSLA